VNLNSLQSIMLSIAQARSVEPILQQIVRGVAEAPEMVLVRLWLLTKDEECAVCATNPPACDPSQPEKPALHLAASAGRSRMEGIDYLDVSGQSHRIPVGIRKIGRIAQTGEALLIPDVTPDQPWVRDPDWVRREGIQSFAGQPLVCRGEVLGVLAVFSRAKFAPEDFQWLRTFADHAAVAIWNARAFDELNRLRTQLELENEYLNAEIKETLHFDEIVGGSKALQKVLQQVELVANTDTTVLILAESGTGKELIARAIHERGSRRTRPLVKVNCGAIPRELFESEFFGHVKGAFTGAVKDRAGRFEVAHGGDLFLDEVGEIPLSLQSKLLRVLQERQFERVGDTRTRSVDVRIIAATNRDLKAEVHAGRFREDLYYRLTVFPIEVPPLRERKEDIAPLADHFVKKSAARMRITPPRLTKADARQLERYDWPGNVRELENVIERAVILSKASGQLHLDLPSETVPAARAKERQTIEAIGSAPLNVLTREEIKKHELENILAALEKTGGKIFGAGGAAELLGMRPTTLASRLKALGVKKQFIAVPPQ
jgi:transcriptional regulator with GAF, ATPase, and Fis domain